MSRGTSNVFILLVIGASCSGSSAGGPGSGTDASGLPPSMPDAATDGATGVDAAIVHDARTTEAAPMALGLDASVDAMTPPMAFPLDAVKAAKPALAAAIGGHIEGPSWRDGDLFFAAVGRGIIRMDAAGKLYRFLPDLAPLGTFLLGDGSLLVCDDKHTLVQVSRAGTVGVLASGGVCNDITVDASGNIYFSDFKGTVYEITPAGVQTQAVTGLPSPNGLEVDPASKYLYIFPRPANIYRVAINQAGPIGMPEKIGNTGGRVTDGCAFDVWGNLWSSNYYEGQIAIFDPVKLQVIATIGAGGGGLTNLTFGGPDRDTLFTTVDGHGVFRIPVGVHGFAGHPGAAKYTVKSMLDIKVVDTPL
jgi:gluconolactonase